MFLGLLRWEKAKHLQTFWIRHHFDWTVVPGNGVKVDAKMFRLSGRDSIGLVNWCSILKEGWSDSHPLHLVFANGISIYKRKVCACTSSIGHINTIAMDAYYMYGQRRRGSPLSCTNADWAISFDSNHTIHQTKAIYFAMPSAFWQ